VDPAFGAPAGPAEAFAEDAGRVSRGAAVSAEWENQAKTVFESNMYIPKDNTREHRTGKRCQTDIFLTAPKRNLEDPERSLKNRLTTVPLNLNLKTLYTILT
jgi:hypothetical protein